MMEQVLNVTTFWTWDSRHGSNLRVMRRKVVVVVDDDDDDDDGDDDAKFEVIFSKFNICRFCVK